MVEECTEIYKNKNNEVLAFPVDRLQYSNNRIYTWWNDVCIDITDNKEAVKELEEWFRNKKKEEIQDKT